MTRGGDSDGVPLVPMTRRAVLLGTATSIAADLAGAATASAQMAQGHREWRAGTPPLKGVRVIESSATLSGRLCGLLLADQGAEVFVERGGEPVAGGLDDGFFDRGKVALPPGGAADTGSADIVIIDGTAAAPRAPHQVLIRVVAALPGDAAYGDLAPDCPEALISAVCGFFTNMSISGPILGRPVIYTPIPLPSVYCAVNAAIAAMSCLIDRQRTGLGRDILASRLASGLSAVGALSITSKGLPAHLEPIAVGGLPPGMTPEQFRTFTADAQRDPERQVWLERRFAPLSTPYRTKDGRWFLPMAGPNRRASRRLLEAVGVWEQSLASGAVYADPYDPASFPDQRRNLGDSLSLGFIYTSKIADLLEVAFLTRTAGEWERFLQANEVPGTIVMSWEEWQSDADARTAGVFAEVPGTPGVQIGRVAWTRSAQPYAPLEARKSAATLPPRAEPPPAATGRAASAKPLDGYTVVDMTNVLAGPSCTRMLGELGATVTRIDVPDPQQPPAIHVLWAGECSAGKRTIILDRSRPDGQRIIRQLTDGADIVVLNKMDDQMARLGVDAATLSQRNPRGIGVQITATRGEKHGPRHHDKGFDPSIQGTTGVMMRFGGADSPTFHGIASAVDYLCGYLGCYASLLALYARERRGDGRGDWAETSLCNAATLIQLLLQPPGDALPAAATGQSASGTTEGARVYQLADGWIYADAPRDISADLSDRSQADALAWCRDRKIAATPVQTCKELADRHRNAPTATVKFEKTTNDGWTTECFAPTWFAFDGRTQPRSQPASPIGADAPVVLAQLGYSADDVARLIGGGAVGRTWWAKS